MIIKGNTVGTNTPRTNYEQTDPKKADYLKGKDKLDEAIAAAKSAADNAATAAGNAQAAANNHASSTSNPHKVTASQVGARPDTWMPSASDVGAAPANHVNNKSNPHKVTASQVGARPDTWMPSASDVGAAPASHASSTSNPHGVTLVQIGAAAEDHTHDVLDLGGNEIIELWKNADTTKSEFPAQTLTLNLEGYSFVDIQCKYTADATRSFVMRFPMSLGGDLYGIPRMGTPYVVARQLVVRSTGVEFYDGYRMLFGETSFTKNNLYAVPWAIYGIKGVN